jgi:hypothetical protein
MRSSLPSLLIAASGAVIGFLGAIHLSYTFASDKFLPRDPDLKPRLEAVSPVLTSQTTMWKAWIGFNASHSLCALLFGAVYGDLALFHLPVLLGSPFLLGTGAAVLGFLLFLGKVYWFRVPFRGIALAAVLYVTGAAWGLLTR